MSVVMSAMRGPRANLWARAIGLGVGVAAWAYASTFNPSVSDAHAYWAASLSDPYRLIGLGVVDAYNYSPAFLWLTEPLRLLPYPLFYSAWEGLIIAALVWLVGLRLLPLVVFASFLMADWGMGTS